MIIKPKALNKLIIGIFCIKLIMIDSIFLANCFAQDSASAFDLAKLQSPPVSLFITSASGPITVSSTNVSFSTNNFANKIKLFSPSVSFNTGLLRSEIKLESKPVSFSLNSTREQFKVSSSPVSLFSDKFMGDFIKVSSNPVSCKTYNGSPVLKEIIPNIIPISKNNLDVNIKLQGDNFVKDSAVSIGTLKIDTEFISSNKLIAKIPKTFLDKENVFDLFVSNPSPQGGVSEGIKIRIVNPIPVAKINAYPNIGVAPQIVTFDSKDSKDILADFFEQPLNVSWNFGDNENNITQDNPNNSTNAISTHKYNKPGKYSAMLHVLNSYGNISEITEEIEIREKNFSPEGTFEIDITKADVPVMITLTSMVFDKENDMISYLWDFGDGSTSTEANPVHEYKIPGKYYPVLTLKDEVGAETKVTSSFIYLFPPNINPVANISAIPNQSILKEKDNGSFSSKIQFSSNGSYDRDGEKLTFLWNFGDGNTSSEENPVHEYSMSGNYKVKLKILDPRKGEDEKEIEIKVSKPNPLALVSVSETNGSPPFNTIFNFEGSKDYDGSSVTLKFDFGDGFTELINSSQKNILHTYENPGVYLVTVIASTIDNRFSIVNPANIVVNPVSGPLAQIKIIEGSDKNIVGKSKVKLSSESSYDSLENSQELKFLWSFSVRTWDINGNLIDISKEVNEELKANFDISKEIFEYTFTRPGQFTPILEIENHKGEKNKAYGETFTVTPEQVPVAVAKIISKNIEGNTGLEVKFDATESYDPKSTGSIKQIIWNFGDGEKSNELISTHVFNKEGTFIPTLIVVDSENNIGFAQTNSIKILNSSSEVTSRKYLNQEAAEDPPTHIEEIEKNITSMINEALNNQIVQDNINPEIGHINIEPKNINSGGTIKLSCFLRDNIALNNFSYKIYDTEGKILAEKIIDLINTNDEKILLSEKYIEEKIFIPKESKSGKYTISLSSSDINGNKSANNTNNEKIEFSFDVSNTISYESLDKNFEIAPSEISDPEEEQNLNNVNVSSRIYNKPSQNIEEYEGSYVKDKNTVIEDFNNEDEKSFRTIEANYKNLNTDFNTTEIVGVVNPYISFSPSSRNTLTLLRLNGGDGFIDIGTSGSLIKNYFSKWFNTNVYIDGEKVGTVFWAHGARIKFTSTIPSITKYIQFRPVDNNGNELGYKAGAYFTLSSKILDPVINSISHTEITAGNGSFDLRIDGSNFNQGSIVYFNNLSVIPSVSSSNYLIVRVPATIVYSPGNINVSVLNSNGQRSNLKTIEVKQYDENTCNINTLPRTIYGGEKGVRLYGGNVYKSGVNSEIEGSGSVIIPFCIESNYEIKTSIKITHIPLNNTNYNTVSFYLDGNYIGQTLLNGYKTLYFENLNTLELNSGKHFLTISFTNYSDDKLRVEFAEFKNGGGPILEDINPKSISLEGSGRKLTIFGKNFDNSTRVFINDNQVVSKIESAEKIIADLKDKYDKLQKLKIQLVKDQKPSTITYLNVNDEIKIVNNSFKIDPLKPFPGNPFNIDLELEDLYINPSYSYKAYVGLFDPDLKLITYPGISNGFSTIVINGTVSGSKVKFNGSIPLNINSKAGNYTLITSIERKSEFNSDYSSIDAANFIAGKYLGIGSDINLVPGSHRLNFTPRPQITVNFGVEENNLENAGFVILANKIIQDGQKIKYKVEISNGAEYLDKLRFKFYSGDGKISDLTSNTSEIYTYENKNINSTIPLTYNPKLEIYWIDDNDIVKITDKNGPTLQVFPNYKPVAKAKVFTEKYPAYSDKPPLITGFVDLSSYDPNQNISRIIDFVDPFKNSWQLFSGTIGQNEKILTQPLDSKISEDKKTFTSGSLTNPGTYFAKLTVQDTTGQTDTASTESVTVTKPSQRVVVFASTDPEDKKIYNLSSSSDQRTIPVKFKSKVTVLGGKPVLNYKWDFGDGTCKFSKDEELPKDCMVPNPEHVYYDGKKSFGGISFIDRKSVTPTLTVTAKFPDGKIENWQSSAGSITFAGDPNFILLDIKPDIKEGLAPLTVKFVIDKNTAKQINTEVIAYEFDFGDGNKEGGNINFSELIQKEFNHVYTAFNTYTPKLTVTLTGDKKLTFNIEPVAVSATGTGGIYLLDDLSQMQFTNDPVIGFMILSVYPNPLDLNNGLRIKLKNEKGEEVITELNPYNDIQVIALSEGKNIYYFEASDSSNQKWMSDIRDIVLDSVDPILNLKTPFTGMKTSLNKILLSGTVIEDNFEKIEYKINDSVSALFRDEDMEEVEKNQINFYKEIDLPDKSAKKITLTVYDKAQNTNSVEVNLNDENIDVMDLYRLEDNTPGYISNYTDKISFLPDYSKETNIKANEPFYIQSNICIVGDNDGQKDKYFQLKDYSVSIDGKDYTDFFKESSTFFANLTIPVNDLDGRGCAEVFKSRVLNFYDDSFFSSSFDSFPNKKWLEGPHTLKVKIFGPDYTNGIDLIDENGNKVSSVELNYSINIDRNPELIKKNLRPAKFRIYETSNVSFDLVVKDSIIHSANFPVILTDKVVWSKKPEGSNILNPEIMAGKFEINESNLTEVISMVTFDFKPDTGTGKEIYELTIPVEFASNSDREKKFTKNLKIPFVVIFNESLSIEIPDNGRIITSSEFVRSSTNKPPLPGEKIPKKYVFFKLNFSSDKEYNFSDKKEKRFNATYDQDNKLIVSSLLNFNLRKNNKLDNIYKNGNAFGPITFRAQLTNDKYDESYDTDVKEYLLLDELKFKKVKLLKRSDGAINLDINISSNTKYSIEEAPVLHIKAFKGSEELSLDPLCGIQELKRQICKNNFCTSEYKTIDSLLVSCLPPETTKIELELHRNEIFISKILSRIDQSNTLIRSSYENNSIVQIADKAIINILEVQSTNCFFTPNEANVSSEVKFDYETDRKEIYFGDIYGVSE